MAKYNGPATIYSVPLYGVNGPEPLLSWGFQVAWNGTYDGSNEAFGRAYDIYVKRGRDHLIASGGKGFEYYQPGEASIVLDNEDGRYDAWNVASPLYPYVMPGKFCRLVVRDNDAGVTYGVMRGVIEDIQPMSRNGRACVRITVKDGLSFLANVVVKEGLMQSVPREEPLLSTLNVTKWNQTEWPWVASLSTDVLDFWWAWQITALDAFHKMTDGESGVVFHDRDGNLKFRTRGYTYQRTLAVDQSILLSDIAVSQPWELVRNQVCVVSHTKYLDTVTGAVVLWQLQDIPAIADGESFVVEATYAWDRFSPVAGGGMAFTFAVNTQSDGLGADLSASCTLTWPTEEVSGEGVTLTLTNNSGSDGFITSLVCTGTPVEDAHPARRRDDDTASQAIYGVKTMTVDSQWMEDTTQAQTRAAWLLYFLTNPKIAPTIQFESRPSYQFYLDLYDRVELTIPKMGINLNFRVGSISHRWLRENGSAVQTTMKLEPYTIYFDPALLWEFTATFGTTTFFA